MNKEEQKMPEMLTLERQEKQEPPQELEKHCQ